MQRSVAESEQLFEQVKRFFWFPEEQDFAIRFVGQDMTAWQLIPTATPEEMMSVRIRLSDEEGQFAGFIRHEGRYCFYFYDCNILKVQYLGDGEISYFDVHSFCELDLSKVAEELQSFLQGS